MMLSLWFNLGGDLFFRHLYSSFISSGFIYFMFYTGCFCMWAHITLIHIVVKFSLQSVNVYSAFQGKFSNRNISV